MVALNKTYQKTLTPDRSAKDSGLRFYSPEISRWLNRDPIGEMGGINLYASARNNAIGVVDPLGQNSITLLLPFLDGGNIEIELCCTCISAQIEDLGWEIQTPAPYPEFGPYTALSIPTYRVGRTFRYSFETEGDGCGFSHSEIGYIDVSKSAGGATVSHSVFDGTPADVGNPAEDLSGFGFLSSSLSSPIANTYTIAYDLAITISCTGTDDSSAEDSLHFSGARSFKVAGPIVSWYP
jgi:RHS repeat-associated protein